MARLSSASKLPPGYPQSIVESASRRKPNVIPVKYGIGSSGTDFATIEDLSEGLFFKNIGDGPAFDVIVSPFKIGNPTVSFAGAEVTYLEVGDTCFFRTCVDCGSGGMFRLLRDWQNSINDLGAEVEGRVQFKDEDGMGHETRYKVGVDVLNRDSGIVVRVEISSGKGK